MNIIAPILILAALAAVTLLFLYLKKKKKADNAWKEPAFSRAERIIASTPASSTPNGHKVHFEAGAKQETMSYDAMDRGVEKTFAKGECAGYAVDRPRHRITFVVFNSEPDSQGDPCYRQFIKPGNPYFGGEFDKKAGQGEEVDHYILVAAQIVAIGDPLGDVIVVPHHTGNEVHLATVCEYEMEHAVLAAYDGPKFEATKTHGFGQGHPLMDDCPGMFSSAASQQFAGLCGGVATK